VPDVIAYQREPLSLRYYPESWANRADDEICAFVQRQIDDQAGAPRPRFQLAITLAESGALIDNCGIRIKPGGPGEIRGHPLGPANAWEADIGYELAPAHWGRGYATEAARAIVAFGFRELGLHRISATCIADNEGSARVLKRAGLRLEGRLRENEHFRGRWWDTLVYAVLAHEWEAAPLRGERPA